MTTRKTNNSILVLATLGVYLGLVLIGATPQVLAQAAMTKQFNVKDEVEVKDNLDKKPDDELAIEQFASSFEELYKIAAEISAEHPDDVLKGAYSFDFYVSVPPGGNSTLFSPSAFNNGTRIHSGRIGEPLRRLYDAFLARTEKSHENFFVQFGFGNSEISFKTTITALDSPVAASSASAYEKALIRLRSTETNYLKSVIFEASKVTTQNNQIFIVTRLPRADLDALLASNAK